MDRLRTFAQKYNGPFSNSSNPILLVQYYLPLVFSILTWIVLFVATAVSQHKSKSRDSYSEYHYHLYGHQLYSFVWWTLFFQLFVYGLINGFKFFGMVNKHFATLMSIIALIQSIIVTDRYIYSDYGSEKAMCAGALMISVADFVWLYALLRVPESHFDAAPANDVEKMANLGNDPTYVSNDPRPVTGAQFAHQPSLSADTAVPEAVHSVH